MRKTFFNLLVITFLFAVPLSAQTGNPAQASDSTNLKTQFDDMVRISNRYQQFRVVPQEFLNAFMANVSDSIMLYTNEIGTLEGTVAAQAEKIENLSQDIKDRDSNITALRGEKDSMGLLGIQLGKGTYTAIIWSIISGLLALLVFAILRMRVAVASANEAKETSTKLA